MRGREALEAELRSGGGCDRASRVYSMMRWFRRRCCFSRAVLALAAAWLFAALALAPASAAGTSEPERVSARVADGANENRCAVDSEKRRHTHECPIGCLACSESDAGTGAGRLASAVSHPASPTSCCGVAARFVERVVIRPPARIQVGSPRAPPQIS